MKTLLIVESPAKSKTIEKLLGPNYIVRASFGHIRNLDKNGLGIDIENGFKPTYKILSDKSKQIKAIQETIKTVDRVFLAADEDREGEAIAWHCAIVFKLNIKEANRICFHEITKNALEHAVANPRSINMDMVNSQQARRILDRLVGFQLSPLLWKHIAPKLSAGRVQSAALKLITDKEVEIEKSIQKKTFRTIGYFNKNIIATLNHNFTENEPTLNFLNHCKNAQFQIENIDKKQIEKKPPPPYITSSIQQDIGTRFGISAKNTMLILQKLYEHGFITYHRTDNTNLSAEIKDEIKNYVLSNFGQKYSQVRNYNSKIKCAQEAHEAIRPTSIARISLSNNKSNEGDGDENGNDDENNLDNKIYQIIWKRTVASQMAASLSELFTMDIKISERPEKFIAKAEKLIFDGYKKVYQEIKDEDAKNDEDDTFIEDEKNLKSNFLDQEIEINEILNYTKINSSEKYNQTPPRYNESSLIKKMEKIGIGRPSTYSNIIETILERKYVEIKNNAGKKMEIIIITLEKNQIKNKIDSQIIGAEKKKLRPSDLGISTSQFLEKNFTNILDYNFTSNLEQKLDEIANSNAQWNNVISDFYGQFRPSVEKLNNEKASSSEDKKRFLGVDEESGKNTYAYIAKYGPVIQIGESNDKEKKYIKIEEPYKWETITLSEIYNMNKFPKKLGKYKEFEIYLKKGQYGLYLSYNECNYKLINDYDENLTLDEAILCINDKKIDNISRKIDKYEIKNGPYGPYILFDKKFFKITDKYKPEDLTKEDCKKIISDTKSAPKKKFVKKN